MEIIAHIYTDLPSKFGVPRQSGLVQNLTGRIVFEEKYRVKEPSKTGRFFLSLGSVAVLRCRKDSDAEDSWSPSVKPPRLGGKTKMGVFATRSPFRPNHIGLSSVKLEKIEYDRELGPVLLVSGIDMMDGTPVYDIKPYLEYVDSHPGAGNGFAQETADAVLQVEFPEALMRNIPQEKRDGILGILEQDPRPCLSRLSGACVRRGIRRI